MNERWNVATRIGFRWGILAGALLIYPFPLSRIPKTDGLQEVLSKPVEWAISGFAQSVLGIADPPSAFNGSGDRTRDYVFVLLVALVATLGTIVWSVVDRRRTAYPRLAAAAHVVMRYWVASVMLSYGLSKILKQQFPDLQPGWLYERLGDMSPMRLAWVFVGYSTPYTVFSGLAEAIGGALLLWRRTATLGAVLLIVVMSNVVLLNFCYDIPVKLYSSQILIMAGLIAWPGARRMLAAALGHPVAGAAPRVRMSRRQERARLAAKLVLIGMIGLGLYLRNAGRPDANDHGHELYGAWVVETFIADGVEHPPLASDAERWQVWVAHARYAAVWLMTGVRENTTSSYPLEVDAAAHTITVTVDEAKHTREVWHYSRPAPDRLVIDAMHRGKQLHVALRLAPDPPLMTRGFRWINEAPFNR
jgi:uncharacterized membrane protein YphA (DoxX/SURF4 family)